jgi:hypothetical protein
VQPVVEGAEHTHQRGRLFHAEMQMLRRVEDQRRVENGEAERREDLNEEQRGRSLRSRGEKTRFDEADAHHIIFARYLASLTVYVASSQSAPFIMRSFVARRAGSCQAAPG